MSGVVNLSQQIEAEQAQLDADVATLAGDALPTLSGPAVPPTPPTLDPFERAVAAHDESMAILAAQGLLTSSFTTNLSLRS